MAVDCRLYSIIVEIIAYVFLLLAGLGGLGLFEGSTLKETIAWREKLQEGMHELPMLRDDWKQRGLSFPNSIEKIQVELAKTMLKESKLRRQRTNVNAALFVVGTILLIFSKLPALGISFFAH